MEEGEGGVEGGGCRGQKEEAERRAVCKLRVGSGGPEMDGNLFLRSSPPAAPHTEGIRTPAEIHKK